MIPTPHPTDPLFASPLAPIPLQAGATQLIFLPKDGCIRNLAFGGHEILRGVDAPIRDKTWSTVRPQIRNLFVDQSAQAFRLTFTAHCKSPEVDFVWQGAISGAADGTIVFEFAGKALIDFYKNRIGFCVLHGAQTAGASCQIKHTDGTNSRGHFPETIQADAPFSDLRAIIHQVVPGLEAETLLEGDTFEMEDQRNWTDASFKTYCTPLSAPRPLLMAKGSTIRQRVTVRIHKNSTKLLHSVIAPWQNPAKVQIVVGSSLQKNLPELGTIWKPELANNETLRALEPLRLAHLRIDLCLSDPGHRIDLYSAVAAAAQLDVSLELAILVNDDARSQLTMLCDLITSLSPVPSIARWIVFHEDHECTPVAYIHLLRTVLSEHGVTGKVGGGATDNFTELNRNPATAAAGEFTAFACNPQVHAFQDASLMETTAIQGAALANARRLAKEHPVSVSPITLTRRWRLSERDAPQCHRRGFRAFQEDPRQVTAFAAAWTLGSLTSLAREGAASLTYFEAVGANGLLNTQNTRQPAYSVLAAVAAFQKAEVIATASDYPLCIEALGLESKSRRALLLGNLRNVAQNVQISGAWGDHSIQLAPYGIYTHLLAF